MARKKWVFSTGYTIGASPALAADGTIYVNSYNGKLYAVNPADGSQKWVFASAIRPYYMLCSPAVASDGTIYLESGTTLYALNPADGSQKWSFPAGAWVSSCPALGRRWHDLYHDIYRQSLCPQSGGWFATVAVHHPMGAIIHSSRRWMPMESFIFGDDNGELYAVNTQDGTLVWSVALGGAISSSPTLSVDGTLYVGAGAKLSAIDQVTQPILTLSKSATPVNPMPGDTVSYTLAYSNAGIDSAG